MPARTRLVPTRTLFKHPWLRDLAALALLTGLALVACGFLLRDDLFIYGDNPGQFMRLWYPLRVSHQLLGWNPLWYAGYPELQFYPPGFVMLGWGLDLLTWQRLSPFALYQLLIFVAYLLPGLTIYALASRVSKRRWAGLVSGALGLIFSELWGGAVAIFVGLVAERLAFGLVPLAMLAGWQALHQQRPARWWLLASLVLTAIVLMHPFHAVAPVLFLGVAALFSPRRWVHLRKLVLSGILALAMVAFWMLPLLIHQRYAVPMLRANLDQTLAWLFGPNVWPYLALCLLLPLALVVQRRRSFAIFCASLLVMAVALIALILFDHLVLIDRLGFYMLDPVRFSAEVYLAIVLLAGLGLAHLPIWLSQQRAGRVLGLLGGLAVILALAWLARPFADMVRGQRNPDHFMDGARQRLPLDATWEALQTGPGRILFTSHYLHLDDMPTAIKATTPYFTGRTMVGGTFSHWSPVARVMWVGSIDVDLLPGQVELADDVSLAGRAWADWTDADFFDLCHRLNVTTVAATWADINARTFLDSAPHFESFYSDDLSVLYRVLDPAPALVEADGATVRLLRAAPTALDLHITEATPGANLRVKITDYPLWQAQTPQETLPHHAGELGLMNVPLPPGSYSLTLRYLPGPAERIGTWLSLGAAVLWLVILVRSLVAYKKKPTPQPEQHGRPEAS